VNVPGNVAADPPAVTCGLLAMAERGKIQQSIRRKIQGVNHLPFAAHRALRGDILAYISAVSMAVPLDNVRKISRLNNRTMPH